MKIKTLSFILLSAFLFSGCGQLKQLMNFSTCEFRTEKVDNLTLGSVNIQNIKSVSDINLLTMAGLLKTVSSGKLPLQFTINIEAKNPNEGIAAMNKIEWIAEIDSTELTRGVINERVEIAANSTASFPVHVQTDLLEVFKGKAGKSLINLALNLVGADGQPTSKLAIKVKPSIMIGTYPLSYPGYINVKKEFGNQVE